MFNSKSDNMGAFFRKSINGFNEDLPDRVWDNISAELEKGRKRKKRILYLCIAASVALIFSFLSGYFLALNNAKQIQYANKTEKNKQTLNLPEHRAVHNNNLNTNPVIPDTMLLKTPIFKQKNTSNQKLQEKLNIIQIAFDNTTHDSVSIFKKQNLAHNNTITDSSALKINYIYGENTSDPDSNTMPSIAGIKPTLPVVAPPKIEIPQQKQNSLQTPNMANNTKGKWTVGEQFSPVAHLAYPQESVLADQTNPTYGYTHTQNTQNENYINHKKIRFVFATGAHVKYTITSKWGVKLGLFYVTGELNNGFQHKQIDIPISASYAIINNKFIWELNGGMSPDFILSYYKTKPNISALFGTTLGYKISPKLTLAIEPTTKYSFSYPQNYIFNYYPLSFALYSGISYNF